MRKLPLLMVTALLTSKAFAFEFMGVEYESRPSISIELDKYSHATSDLEEEQNYMISVEGGCDPDGALGSPYYGCYDGDITQRVQSGRTIRDLFGRVVISNDISLSERVVLALGAGISVRELNEYEWHFRENCLGNSYCGFSDSGGYTNVEYTVMVSPRVAAYYKIPQGKYNILLGSEIKININHGNEKVNESYSSDPTVDKAVIFGIEEKESQVSLNLKVSQAEFDVLEGGEATQILLELKMPFGSN